VNIAEEVLRSWGQRSGSGSDGHGNLVNLIAAEPTKGFEYKLTQTLVGRRTDLVFKVMNSKGRITETFTGEDIRIDDSPSNTILFDVATCPILASF